MAIVLDKDVERLINLISLKTAIYLDKEIIKYTQKLNLIFEKYVYLINKELISLGVYQRIYENAGQFRLWIEDNPFVDDLGDEASKHSYEVFVFLKEVFDLINNRPEHKEVVSSALLSAYNISGYSQAYSTVLQSIIYRNKKKKENKKKAYYEDDLSEEYDSEVGDINVDVHFTLKEENLLNALKIRAYSINFLSDLDFKQITEVLITVAYEEGGGISDIAEALVEKLKDISYYRAELIARTEMAVASSEATMEFARKSGIEWKRWLTVGDAKVREQHIENELVGVVPLEETFSSPTEYSPGQCESPYNCRCVLQAVADPNLGLSGSYWDGEQMEQIFDV